MSLSGQSVVTVTKDQVSCSLGTEAAILNVKDGIYYGLDPVGAHIWKLLQTPCKVADIQEALLQEARPVQTRPNSLARRAFRRGADRGAVNSAKAVDAKRCSGNTCPTYTGFPSSGCSGRQNLCATRVPMVHPIAVAN
jgi:coenzyme PQQ synthesis protein D (PqqD)